MNTKKISIIIPVYNVEKFFNRCIESVVQQTYKNLEIILVDDGSKDSSGAMCDEWAQKDERIKVIHQKNSGASSARNTGLAIATGDYIGFIDADDTIDSDMYEFLYNNLISTNSDISRCGMIREGDGDYKEVWGSDDAEAYVINKTQAICSVGEANGILPVSPCNKLFKSSIVKDIKFDTDLVYAEDTLFNYKAAKKSERVVLHDKPKYHYIRNGESASHQKFNESRFDEHKVTDIIMESEKGNPKTYPYCVKGDVQKAFRTIKHMMVDNSQKDKFKIIRKRILDHKKDILKNGIYSKATKVKTLMLWIMPDIYKQIIKLYGKYADYRYQKKVEKE